MEKIGNASFRRQLKINNGSITGKVTSEKILITEKDWDFENGLFQDVDFKYGIKFANISDLGSRVEFKRCKGSIKIQQCGFHEPEDKNVESLIFNECNLNYLHLTGNKSIINGVRIGNKSTIQKFGVYSCSLINGGLEIKDSAITNEFKCHQLTTSVGLTFINSDINCVSNIHALDGNLYSLYKSSFHKKFDVQRLNGSLIISDSKFYEDVNVKNIKSDEFKSYDNSFEKGFQLELNENLEYIGIITIQNTETGTGMNFKGTNQTIKEIKIPATAHLSGVYKFSNFISTNLNLSGLNSNANLIFKEMSFSNIEIEDFLNKAGVTFSNCKGYDSDAKLSILDSHLGNTVFLSFDFKSFGEIRISSSVLHDIELSNPKLFNPEQLVENDHDKINRSARKREVYRQIRHAVSKKGDSILSTDLKAIELNLFRDEKANSFLDKDRIMLWLSSTNDMGLNWFKPLLIVFLITIPFYMLTIVAFNDSLKWMNPIDFCSVHWKNTWDAYSSYWPYFWSMFNPVRNIRDLLKEGGSLTGAVYFWDGLHRIVLAFFIFQIVTAFRKYIK